jgi:hypothetical protein
MTDGVDTFITWQLILRIAAAESVTACSTNVSLGYAKLD